MANEITIQTSFRAQKGSAYGSSVPGFSQFQVSMTGDAITSDTQYPTTTIAQIDFGGAAAGGRTVGWIWIHNNDTTNYVEISYGNGTGSNFTDKYITKIKPGEDARFRVNQNAVYWRSGAGTPQCSLIACED